MNRKTGRYPILYSESFIIRFYFSETTPAKEPVSCSSHCLQPNRAAHSRGVRRKPGREEGMTGLSNPVC